MSKTMPCVLKVEVVRWRRTGQWHVRGQLLGWNVESDKPRESKEHAQLDAAEFARNLTKWGCKLAKVRLDRS